MPQHDYRSLRHHVTAEQHEALKRVAAERGVPVSQIVAAGIALATGVPDPVKRHVKDERQQKELLRT